MRQRGIAVEVQDTVGRWMCHLPRSGLHSPGMLILILFSLQPNACATFNFLCHEGRVTGAALIPPPGETALASLGQALE